MKGQWVQSGIHHWWRVETNARFVYTHCYKIESDRDEGTMEYSLEAITGDS